MNLALWRKAASESKWLLLCCAAALFAFAWIRVALVGHIEMSKFASIIGELWGDISDFSAVPLSHILKYEGRIAVMYNEPLVVLLVSIWAITRGSDVVSGELGRGSMEMLLAQPVSRLQVLWSQAVVAVAGLAVLCAVTYAGTAVGVATVSIKETPKAELHIPLIGIDVPLPWDVKLPGQEEPEPIYTPMSDRVEASVFTPATINLFCLGFFLLGMTTLLSSFDRYRWRTIGIAVCIWVVMSVCKVVGMAVEDWAWLQNISFFTPYAPEWAVFVGMEQPDNGLWLSTVNEHTEQPALSPLANNVILLVLGTGCYTAATVVFARRDLPAPL